MIKFFIKIIKNKKKLRGLISIAAGIIMYFTPDNIDHIIQGILSVYGITALTIDDKKDKKEKERDQQGET